MLVWVGFTNPLANASPGRKSRVPTKETSACRKSVTDRSACAKQKGIMKEKPNYAELETRIDFTALAGRLGQLTEKDNPQRKT